MLVMHGTRKGGGGIYMAMRRLEPLTSPTLEAKVNTCNQSKPPSMRSSHLWAEIPPPPKSVHEFGEQVFTFDDIIQDI